MVVVMAAEAGDTEIDGVVDRVRAAGGDAFVSRGMSRTIVGLVGDVDRFETLNLRGMPGVSDVVRISAPYKLVSREHHRARSVIRVGGVPIGPDMTTGELHDLLAPRGAKLMLVALSARERGTLQLTPQPQHGATYAAKIDKGETRIDWAKPWNAVHDHCRGLSPFPGAWFDLSGAGRIKVLRTTRGTGSGLPGQALDDKLTIACGEGALRLVELQRAGGKPMPADEFLRGLPQ